MRKIKLIFVYMRFSIAEVAREINRTYFVIQWRSESSLVVINSVMRVTLLSGSLIDQRDAIPELCDLKLLLTHKYFTHVDVSHLLLIYIHITIHNIIFGWKSARGLWTSAIGWRLCCILCLCCAMICCLWSICCCRILHCFCWISCIFILISLCCNIANWCGICCCWYGMCLCYTM